MYSVSAQGIIGHVMNARYYYYYYYLLTVCCVGNCETKGKVPYACDCLLFQDTLREDCDRSDKCLTNCCVSPLIAPVYFVVFVLMAQFVLVNVVVAVLMKHLEVSSRALPLPLPSPPPPPPISTPSSSRSRNLGIQ